MTTHFAEVLARESADLGEVTDNAQLDRWRRRVVAELMSPSGSPYQLALRQNGDLRERAAFLGRWRRLLADAIERVLRCDDASVPHRPSTPPGRTVVDPERTATLILAALHGGCTLSKVAQDPRPLNAALDIALAPLLRRDKPSDANRSRQHPDQ